jgi:hypothetical protein
VRFAILIVSLAVPLISTAGMTSQSRFKDVHLYPPGTVSCGKWVEERNSQRRGDRTGGVLQLEAYASGYLTAYNTYVASDGDVLRELDDAGRRVFIDKWCGENPTSMFTNAVSALIRQAPASLR